MIYDLQKLSEETTNKQTEVCIIGAGTAGIYLAKKLREKGISVILIETGDYNAKTSNDLDLEPLQKGLHYNGAKSGRSFGIGGTSVLWGGQMIPLMPSDFSGRQKNGIASWPIAYEEMAKYLPIVANDLGLGTFEGERKHIKLLKKHYEELSSIHSIFKLRLSQWLPFKMRNFVQAFDKLIHHDQKLQVWLNATVEKMNIINNDSSTEINQIIAKNINGNKLLIESNIVVVCAGVLESTRLLLQFDEEHNHIISKQNSQIGKFFADHLSVECGKFIPKNWKKFNMVVAPIFKNGVMRTPRLELTSQVQKEKKLTSAFAHFTFETNGDTGFDIVRSILRKRQGENQEIKFQPSMLWKAIRDISAMIWWRFVYKRLWIPREADMKLQVDIEQFPNHESRLYLSDQIDSFGRKKLVIDWQITDKDLDVVREVASLSADIWNTSKLNKVAELHLSPLDNLDSFQTPYDVYHPTGSLRMGDNPETSVTNSDLRLWSVNNCYVSTTAVFPSAGSANPGMTHLALTARLADHIVQQLGVK